MTTTEAEGLLENKRARRSLELRAPHESEFEAWDKFVLTHPHGSPFHLMAWKRTIEDSFHYKPHYLMARDATGIRGVLPMFLVRNPVVGCALISSPFAVYGGILAETEEARKALYNEARSRAEALRADYIELRNGHAEQCIEGPNFLRYVTFTRPVCPDQKATLGSLPQKTRNTVRKALQQGFSMRYGVRDASAFEKVHSQNMHRIGTLTLPIHYIWSLLHNFGSMVDIREVVFNGIVVAVSLSFLYREQMHTLFASTDPSFNKFAPNSYMYFDHLCWAGANGYNLFDFGRSKKGGGVFEFKKRWGTAIRELPYEITLIRRKELPTSASANRMIPVFTAVWKRLPLPVARSLSRVLLPLFP
jgi:FemAB-related protein (PEP-CTERM system-associated)